MTLRRLNDAGTLKMIEFLDSLTTDTPLDCPPVQRKTWNPTQDKRGFECRYCSCRHFRVIYTRPTWGGRIMRRRECRN